MLLLNKADLLPTPLRAKWAAYFDSLGLQYVFWSAAAATAQLKGETPPAPNSNSAPVDTQAAPVDAALAKRAELVDCDTLISILAHAAASALQAAQAAGEERPQGHTPTVGLIGYPNVGKSSTINALFGSKKTPVAPTPGKTKHFQTLHIAPGLMLCDCPGLVMPRLASSKAAMVAAGALRLRSTLSQRILRCVPTIPCVVWCTLVGTLCTLSCCNLSCTACRRYKVLFERMHARRCGSDRPIDRHQ